MNPRFTLGAVLLLAACSAWAQHDDSGTPLTTETDAEAICQEMAKEDRIPAGDMQDYMKDCMTSFEDEVPSGDMEAAPAGR